jgi:glutamine amidotransferase of anthranilate synthase or aminodeoxychorismate synthase
MSGKIIIIDNYDSFTYNLFQLVGAIDPDVEVIRNDKSTAREIYQKDPARIILSPGPRYPKDAGITEEIIRLAVPEIPILGVCLGHQAIGEVFGGRIIKAAFPVHGKPSEIKITGENCILFKGLPQVITAGRYHSLIVERETLPPCLEITAETFSGEIMGLRHAELPVYGVQFHPESIITPYGQQIIGNFLR